MESGPKRFWLMSGRSVFTRRKNVHVQMNTSAQANNPTNEHKNTCVIIEINKITVSIDTFKISYICHNNYSFSRRAMSLYIYIYI